VDERLGALAVAVAALAICLVVAAVSDVAIVAWVSVGLLCVVLALRDAWLFRGNVLRLYGVIAVITLVALVVSLARGSR
jgi:hypothetical protein